MKSHQKWIMFLTSDHKRTFMWVTQSIYAKGSMKNVTGMSKRGNQSTRRIIREEKTWYKLLNPKLKCLLL